MFGCFSGPKAQEIIFQLPTEPAKPNVCGSRSDYGHFRFFGFGSLVYPGTVSPGFGVSEVRRLDFKSLLPRGAASGGSKLNKNDTIRISEAVSSIVVTFIRAQSSKPYFP